MMAWKGSGYIVGCVGYSVDDMRPLSVVSYLSLSIELLLEPCS